MDLDSSYLGLHLSDGQNVFLLILEVKSTELGQAHRVIQIERDV